MPLVRVSNGGTDMPMEIASSESNRDVYLFKADGTITRYNIGTAVTGDYLKIGDWGSSGYTLFQALQPGTYTIADRYYTETRTVTLTSDNTFPYTLTTPRNRTAWLFYVVE